MNGQIWPKICIFGHVGPNIGLSDPFGAMPDQKNNLLFDIFDKYLADLFQYCLICLFNLMVKIFDRFEICFP